MDALAAAAGATKPTLYRYFDNKEALFAAALQGLLEQHRMLSLPMQSASYRAGRFWDSNLQPYHAMQRLLAAQRDAGTLDVADAASAASHSSVWSPASRWSGSF